MVSVADLFSQFTLLESSLAQPNVFVTRSSTFVDDWKLRHRLVERYIAVTFLSSMREWSLLIAHCTRYYSLDDGLCRELLGSKLSTRFRRDLADTAERCGLRLRSCRRQYENLRRVARLVEDTPGHLFEIIRRSFVLPSKLAETYAAMIFLSANRCVQVVVEVQFIVYFILIKYSHQKWFVCVKIKIKIKVQSINNLI